MPGKFANYLALMSAFAVTACVASASSQSAQSGQPAAGADLPQTVDGVAAIVDGSTVLLSDVHRMVAPLYEKLRRSRDREDAESRLKDAFSESLDSLVDRQLILSHNTKLDRKALDPMLRERENELVRDRFKGDRAAFLAAMSSEGMSLEEWRKEMGDRMLVSFVQQQEISARLMISPGAVWREYDRDIDIYRTPEQVKVRTIKILKARSTNDLEIARKKAESVVARLAEGAGFESLVGTFSEDAKSSTGGDWGWIEPGQLPRVVGDAARDLDAGRSSGVLEDDDAFWVVKVEAKRAARVKPLEEVWPDIERKLEMREYERLYEEWTRKLRGQSYVKIISK